MRRASIVARDYADFPAVDGDSVLYIHLGKLRPKSDERGFYLWEDRGLCRAMPRFSMMSIVFDERGSSHIGLLEEWRPVVVLERPRFRKDRVELDKLLEAHVCLSTTSPTPWNRPEGFLGPGVSLYSARLFCRDNAPFMWRYQVQCTLAGRTHYSTHIEASCDMLEDWQNIRATPSYHPLT